MRTFNKLSKIQKTQKRLDKNEEERPDKMRQMPLCRVGSLRPKLFSVHMR